MDYIKGLVKGGIGFYVALFSILAVGGWTLNGCAGTKFVIKDLIDVFTWIFAQLSVKHGIDSWLNTPKGVEPQ